jgi:hypothetical protein
MTSVFHREEEIAALRKAASCQQACLASRTVRRREDLAA